MNVVQITFGPVSIPKVIEAFRAAGYAGTIHEAQGFTPQWGVEESVVLEIATSRSLHSVQNVVEQLLRDHGEDCAYVTVTSAAPRLWWSSGKVEFLTED